MDNSKIVQRFDALESERKGSVEQLWDMIERFVLPFRGDFYATLTSENEVDWHRRDVYDSTAVFAVQSLAASLQGNLTSPATQWFDLKFRDDELNSKDDAKEWLEECSKRVFEALQDSNFNIEMSESYIDLVGFGTTILTEEVEDELEWKGINFQAIPVREFFFEEDHKKQVQTLYRRLQMTPVQILSQFGDEGTPESIKMLAEAPSGATDKKTVIFCVYKRKDKEGSDTSKLLAPKQRPYGYKYVLKTGQETIGEEGGYYEMPAFVGRWRKVAGSRWGHSPTAVALGDILTLNQLVEATLEAAGKTIDPVTFVNESAILGDLDMDRGGLNVVLDIDGIKEHESRTRFDVSNLTKGELQESIKQAFYQDQLALKESPAMTATEVNVRYELMQRLLGPTLGRLQNDLLDPLVQRTFNIMWRGQQLPEMPVGLTVDRMDIEYTGPLPRAQKLETALAIDNWMNQAAQKAEFFPNALDLVDVDKAEREKASLMGVPAKAMRSEEEVELLREERGRKQAEAEKVAAIQQAGDAAQSVGAGAKSMKDGMGEEGAAQALEAVNG